MTLEHLARQGLKGQLVQPDQQDLLELLAQADPLGPLAQLVQQVLVGYLPAVLGWFASNDLVRRGAL